MLTKYADMMDATRRLVERADEIAGTAEAVVEVMRKHRTELNAMDEAFGGMVKGLQNELEEVKITQGQIVAGLVEDLDKVIALLEGKINQEKPKEPPPEAPNPPNTAGLEVANG